MPVRQNHALGGVPVKIFTDDVDANSVQQLGMVSRLPIVVGHVAAMPDVHLGIGATIGSVIATEKAIIPAAVGVDIGCGMTAVKLSITADKLPDDLSEIRHSIERAIPVGFSSYRNPACKPALVDYMRPTINRILESHPTIRKMIRDVDTKWPAQIGTLGGGNHFIEVCVDELNNVWIMLHSGSRGIGNVIGRYFTKLARDDMRANDRQLPEDRDLAYLVNDGDSDRSQNFFDYVFALGWAQEYALENRRLILLRTMDTIRHYLPEFTKEDAVVECHHNYVTIEEHFGRKVYVTRKGAIRALEGDRGIIPGSMGAKSYIVRGKGCAEAMNSAPHGAGRRMSRSKAKREFTVLDMEKQTSGVECRKDTGVIDEIPGAYKDIDVVLANSADLVDVEATLKQVVCVKG